MKAYIMDEIIELQEAVPDEYAMYKDLDLVICSKCAHYVWPPAELCTICVLSVSLFEEKEEE